MEKYTPSCENVHCTKFLAVDKTHNTLFGPLSKAHITLCVNILMEQQRKR